MDVARPGAAVAVVLGLLALATAASGLSAYDAAGPGGSDRGLGVGSGDGSGVGDGRGIGLQIESDASDAAGDGSYLRALLSAVFGAATVLVAVVAALTLLREGLRGLWSLVADALRVLGPAALLLAAVLAGIVVLDALANGGGGLAGAGGPGSTVLGSDAGTEDVVAPQAPPVLVALAVVLAGLTALVVARRGADGGPSIPSAPARGDSDPPDPPAAPVGPAAADDARASNGVYEAWRELADAVDASATATPAEVARAAREAGYDERRVAELTALFRAVRYGDASPTAERERRARAAVAAVGDGTEQTANS